MRTIGILVTFLGWLLIVRGITHKSPTKSWLASQRDAMQTLYRDLRRRLAAKRKAFRQWWTRSKDRVWHWWQDIKHRLTGSPRNFREHPTDAVVVTNSVTATLSKAPPTAETNLSKIEHLEEQLAKTENQSLCSDAYALLGGLVTFVGSLIVILST